MISQTTGTTLVATLKTANFMPAKACMFSILALLAMTAAMAYPTGTPLALLCAAFLLMVTVTICLAHRLGQDFEARETTRR
jgi:hypothetical protein